MGVHFYTKPSKGGLSAIYLRVDRWGHRIVSSTPYKVGPGQWNEKRGLPETKSAALVKLKRDLERLEAKIEDFLITRSTKIQMKAGVRTIIFSTPSTMEEAFQEFFEKISGPGGSSAFRLYRTAFNQLKNFVEERGEVLDFKDVNLQYLEDFRQWTKVKNFSPNSATRWIKALKTFFKWAQSKKLIESSDWMQVKGTTQEKEITHLNREEVLALIHAPLPERLAKVRDLFCIGCLTGLRYSDLTRITPFNVGPDEIRIRSKKDDDMILIPIGPDLKKILSRYPDLKLPTISNQRGNDYLKEIFKATDLNRPILASRWEEGRRVSFFRPLSEIATFHLARRTFITLSLEMGMTPENIMKITGHSDFKAMRPYLKITDRLRKEQFEKTWGRGLG
jgi:site-specific recombinase XerD